MTPRIALQLWTVRDAYDRDPRAVLGRVAGLGYRAMELVYSRTGGLTHAEQREALDALGLSTASLHCFLDELEDDLDGVLTAADALDAGHVVLAWVPPERRRDAADFRSLADVLTAAGERCAAAGRPLAYHFHDFELAEHDGKRGMDWIFDAVDPAVLAAEVDVYWVDVAGLDPVAYLEQIGERCVLLHCKDRAPAGAAPLVEPGEGLAVFNAEVGEGVLDFPAILAAAPHARWLVTEQDFSAGDPFESARCSLVNLEALARGRAEV